MKITASKMRKGNKIAEGAGYRVMDQVTSKGAYMWCEYREYDSEDRLIGHFASRYESDAEVTKLFS
jgi:hypothetical protein